MSGVTMTSNFEVLCAFGRGEWDYMVTVLVCAQADWLACVEAEARVCAVFKLPVMYPIEIRRVRGISAEERLRLMDARLEGAMWSRVKRGCGTGLQD